ncbi:MAG: DUF882 domain-containing protein [Candidatus Aminicenantales bacterium]|jgi:uncharacterized protein YcbK (DUF882 family)
MCLKKELNDIRLSRRRVLKLGGLAVLAWAVPSSARTALKKSSGSLAPRELSLFNTHTGESLDSVFWEAGDYIPDELRRIDHILRDPLTGETKEMDVRLLDLLHRLRVSLSATDSFHVICGYRCPQTNAALRQKSSGVAAHSLHMLGQAVDIRLPGIPLASLRNAALALKAGGVGYYPQSDFVHVDVGPVRTW